MNESAVYFQFLSKSFPSNAFSYGLLHIKTSYLLGSLPIRNRKTTYPQML